jgi:hypothetical protein
MTVAANIETAKEAARRLAAHQIRHGYVPDGLHVYTDASGKELFWRIRAKHPGSGQKWIRPMHRNGSRFELGEPAFPNGKKPLYRLHDTAAADPARPVWFVEGEKCADVLVKLGLLATTAGGVTADESADFTPLRGRHVICWPDSDQPGRDHMRRISRILRAIQCTVDVVEIDRLTLPDKGDAADYVAAHPSVTADDLEALTRIPSDDQLDGQPIERIELIRGDKIKVEPVRWLWDGWLARGKLHILAGAPGTGKTTIALAMAATITVGGRWPDGSRAGPGSVLIWSGEDDPCDTLAPRLLAMDADMARVHFVGAVADENGRRVFDPARDMRDLLVRAAAISDMRLMIIDPIINAVGGDGHKSNDVRRDLAPVVELASALDCAVLGISHFTKGTAGRDPVERVTGSLAFGALARLILGAAKIKEDDGTERRLLARAKSNIGPDGGGFSYALEQIPVHGHPDISASRVVWGAPIDGTARELLADAEVSDEVGADAKDAGNWLRDVLEERGETDAKTMRRLADDAGHAWRTVQRAAKPSGVSIRRQGFGSDTRTIWALPFAPLAPLAPTTKLGANGASDSAAIHSRSAEVF